MAFIAVAVVKVEEGPPCLNTATVTEEELARELKDAKLMTIVCKKFLRTKLVDVDFILSERNRPTFLVSDKIHG